MSSLKIGFLIAIISAFIADFYPPAIRAVYADGGNTTLIVLITTWARATSMGLCCLFLRKPIFQTGTDIRQAIIGGVFQAISTFGIMASLAFIPGPLVVIIFSTHTIILFFYMAWRGEVKLEGFIIMATLIALGGLTLVLDLWGSQSTSNLWGIGLAFVAAMAQTGRLYAYGHQTKNRHPAIVGAENFIVSSFLTLFVVFYKMPHLPSSLSGDAWAFASCLALALATIGMFFGIAIIGSFRWSLFLKLEPIFTAIFSALLLHEILKPSQYMGIAIVIGSLAIYQFMDHRTKLLASE